MLHQDVFRTTKKKKKKYSLVLPLSTSKPWIKVDTPQKPQQEKNILWFNPPFSSNVATNIGHGFLRILEKNFPKGHPLNKIFNRNSVKVSYRCTPNRSQIISAHKSTILNRKKVNTNQKNCNCKKHENCPEGRQCLTKNLCWPNRKHIFKKLVSTQIYL